MTTLTDSNDRCQSFHKLTFEECKNLYNINLIDTATYILFIVKCHGAAGWKWSFKVKDFCKKWDIKERAFYRGLAKLKEHNLLHWEVSGTITVWHGSDIAKEPDDNNVSAKYKHSVASDIDSNCMSINTLSPVTVDMSPVTVDMSPVTVNMSQVTVNMSPVSQETPVTLAVKKPCNAPDISQINSDTTDSKEELVVALEFCEETQEVLPSAIAFNALTQEAVLEFCEETQEIKSVAPTKSPQELPRQQELKQMGVRVNDPELLKVLAAYQGQIITPIRAFLEYARKKEVKNPTSAFTSAVRQRWEPDKNYEDGGLPKEQNPPNSEQVAKLQELKSQGVIAEFYFSDSGVTKVITFREMLIGKQKRRVADSTNPLPWWEVLKD